MTNSLGAKNRLEFEGQVAVVTGGAGGIGSAIAARFSEEGAAVVLCDVDAEGGRRVEEVIRGRGKEATFVRADVTVEAEVQSVIELAAGRFGRLDILVNNAFYRGAQGPNALELTNEGWERSMDVILKGAWWAVKYALPHMLRQQGGVVLNISSRLAFLAGPNSFAYCIAKAGLVQMVRSLAVDFGRSGIRACAICPGLVETPATTDSLKDPRDREAAIRKRYVNRIATPEDIAEAALYLASPRAAYVQGEAFVIDGGASIV